MVNLHAYVPKQAVPQPFYIVEPPQEFDERGKELGPDAQVWKTYVREADQVDGELVDGWNKSTDVILIFAALFSAISTAFVIESYKNLKQDPADVSSQTLLVISRNIAAMADGSQPTSVSPRLEQAEAPPFTAPLSAIVVNALWFLSLSLSVAVSLISMLAKEWCLAFMSGRTGPPGSQARRRQQRWNGIMNWKMKEVLMALPSLIHLSLLLFAIGLCVFLWNVHFGVAIPVIFVTTIAAGIYIGCTVLPFIDTNCPYGTVLSRLYKHLMSLEPRADHVYFEQDRVTVQALQWMVANCETPRSVDVAFQSLAGVKKDTPWDMLNVLKKWDVCALIKQKIDSVAIDSEHQIAREAAYFQALQSVAKCSDWELKLGSNKETQRLEVLVMGLQSSINCDMAGKHRTLSHQVLRGISRLGASFLLNNGITESVNSHYIEEQLSQEVTQLLKQHLLGSISLEPVVYFILHAALAFLLCCHLEAKPAIAGSHVTTLLRAYFARRNSLEQQYDMSRLSTIRWRRSQAWKTFYSHSIQLRELAFLLGVFSASKYLCRAPSEPFPATDYGRFEKTIESIWHNLTDVIHGNIDVESDIVDRELSRGAFHLLANPGVYNWSSEDYDAIILFYTVTIPNKHEGQSSRRGRTISDIGLSRQFVRDITNYLYSASNTLPPIQILRFLELYARASPWTDEFVPTPEIYAFVITNLCHPESPADQATEVCYRLMGSFPFPKATPWLIQLLSTQNIIGKLTPLLQNTGVQSQAFAMSQLWLLFDMALRFEDRSSDTLSNLETMLLQYDGLSNNLARQEEISEQLSMQLLTLLEHEVLLVGGQEARRRTRALISSFAPYTEMPSIYFYRVYECLLQRCYAPIPELASRKLGKVPDYLRGLSSSISFEDEVHVQV